MFAAHLSQLGHSVVHSVEDAHIHLVAHVQQRQHHAPHAPHLHTSKHSCTIKPDF